MKILISNKIYIHEAPKEFIKVLKKYLTLDNPVYTAMLRRAKYSSKFRRCIYGLKKDFKYYEYDKDNNVFECGRGNLNKIIKYCNENNL